jgi:hypothetical protein
LPKKYATSAKRIPLQGKSKRKTVEANNTKEGNKANYR